MDINGISASAYDLSSWCSWKYFLQYNLGFQDEAGAAALMGTIGHKVLEVLSVASVVKHRKDSKIWNPEYLWQMSFDHYCHKEPHIAEQLQNDKLKKVCKGIHELLAGEYTPVRDNTISAEVAFNIPIEEQGFKLPDGKYFTLRGRIDRVDKINSDTIEIIDYKTGSRVDWNSKDRHKKEPSDLYKEIQPRMYHLAAKHLYPWAKNIIVTFIYLVDGGPVPIPFSDSDIAVTKEILRRRFKTIQADEDPQRNRTWKCNKLCSFGPSGECDSVWNETQRLGHSFIKNKYTVLNIKKRRK